MKSKFFGFTAKLAMAILAVGTMFTSCYDSENGDVTKPYVAPDPVYLISGTITDVETGAAITDATITVNGTAPTQYSDGIFSASGKGGVLNTVTVKKAGYNEDATVTREFTIAALDKGQSSTTVVNIALKKNGTPDPDFDLNKVTMTVTTKMLNEEEVFTPEEWPGLDLAASEEPLFFDRTFTDIEIGAEVKPTIETALDGAPA